MPTNNGIGPVDQFVVPLATPPATAVSHRMTVTPTLSLAVPEMVMAAADVYDDVDDGERIVRLGGVVSVEPPPEGALTVI